MAACDLLMRFEDPQQEAAFARHAAQSQAAGERLPVAF